MRRDDTDRRNLLFFPLGTFGRDMVYALVTNFLLTYILFTQNLSAAQLAAVTAIMIAARIFDALNDPVMGNIIERTRTRWGKFKPWLLAGGASTFVVVSAMFNVQLEGWAFVTFFGLVYFCYSIAYTMHDISYWGMIPALSRDAGMRDRLTSRTTLVAGIGGTLANILIPILTAGQFALVVHNDQLRWVCLFFLLQQVGNGLALSGLASTYIYFEFGYDGSLFSLYTTLGMLPTAFLMVFYPALARRFGRRKLVWGLSAMALAGYAVSLAGALLGTSATVRFAILTLGYMGANFGQYGLYLIAMISILNTVEYNEWKNGTRDEAIIASLRPFFTKLASAITVLMATASYMVFGILEYTNAIADWENLATRGLVGEAEKLAQIGSVISHVGDGQRLALLLTMCLLPAVLLIISSTVYLKKYSLDEDRYEAIRKALEERR